MLIRFYAFRIAFSIKLFFVLLTLKEKQKLDKAGEKVTVYRLYKVQLGP